MAILEGKKAIIIGDSDSADDVCVSALCGVRPFRQSDERRDKTSVSLSPKDKAPFLFSNV